MTATVLSKTVTTEQNRQDLDFRFGLVMTPAPWVQLGVDYFATGDKGGYTKIGSGSSTSKTMPRSPWPMAPSNHYSSACTRCNKPMPRA